MKMPGYWVSKTDEGVSLTQTVFDETDLDPATQWREAYQNQDPDVPVRGYVAIEAALARARQLLPEVGVGVEVDARQLPLRRPGVHLGRVRPHGLHVRRVAVQAGVQGPQ